MDAKEFEALLSDVETRLDRLRALYEQWFQGIERLEPTIPRKEIERRMQLLKRTPIRNTALRFRFQTLWQKYTTFQTYWGRVARQIEEGTYRRDLLRARRRRDELRKGVSSGASSSSLDLDIEVESPMEEEEAALGPPTGSVVAIPSTEARDMPPAPPTGKLAAPPPPPPTAAKGYVPPPPPKPGSKDAGPGTGVSKAVPPPPPASPSLAHSGVRPAAGADLDDQRLRRIYDQYVEARRKNNEPIDNVRYDTVAKSLKDALPKLAQKHHGKKIDFEIVIKDGRVGIKPIAR